MTAPPVQRAAVFLDRDGTLNATLVRDGKPYPPAAPEDFRLLPGVADGCNQLKAAGFVLVVATNQPDVGRGTLRREVVEELHRHLRALLPVDHIEVCYHPGGEVDCECRKPKPGLLLRTAAALGLDLSRSWMVGDRWRDVDCGNAAGCRTVFLDAGYRETLRTRPDFVASDFSAAVRIILAHTPVREL